MGSLDSFNPATGELIGSVPTVEPADVQGAVDDVAEVQPFWGELSLQDRARYLERAAEILAGDVEEVARLLTTEQGKPITESYTMEVVPTIDALNWIAAEGPSILGDRAGPDGPGAVPRQAGEDQLRAARRRRRDRARGTTRGRFRSARSRSP